MHAADAEFWVTHKDFLEDAVARLVSFPVELYWAASAWTGVGHGDSYQFMPTVDAEQERSVFWDWHLTQNEQFFPDPLTAAAAFVQAWRTWIAEAGSGL
jgi:hypothetical protein